jgi:hypothetical protein
MTRGCVGSAVLAASQGEFYGTHGDGTAFDSCAGVVDASAISGREGFSPGCLPANACGDRSRPRYWEAIAREDDASARAEVPVSFAERLEALNHAALEARRMAAQSRSDRGARLDVYA